MDQYQHPHETINLPSEGKYYPEGHPLREGTVDIKYLTAKEEDILTSTNLATKGLTYDKLLEQIVLNKSEQGRGVKTSELLVGDIDAILVAARVLAYGKHYPVSIKCSNCGHDNQIDVDLTEIENRETEGTPNVDGTFDYKLNDDIRLTLKLMTRGDARKIDKTIKNLQDHNLGGGEITTFLRSIIVSVNGDSSMKMVSDFIDNLLISDSRKLRKDYAKYVPGPDFTVDYECERCLQNQEGTVVIGPRFFWPDS